MNYPESLMVAIKFLSKLPGIGKKTAERLAFSMVKSDIEYIEGLSDSIKKLKEKIKSDPVCGCMTDLDKCKICNDPSRNCDIICITALSFADEILNNLKKNKQIIKLNEL